MSRGAPRRAGIYARISLDRREGEGVARQLADCRKLAAERGWEVVGEYVDNDLSAFRAKRRPEWDRLLADLDAGVLDALIAYHPDRTYRRLSDLEGLIDIVERTGAEVATVQAGDVDLSTATGRMGARIGAAVNRHESERIGERVSRAKRERAAQGRPAGGGFRAFGYEPDKVTIRPDEADLIRAIAERVAAGGPMYAEARMLNELGYRTTGGKEWDVASLRRVLTSPRIAGLRAYRGQVVGEAVWPSIIPVATWERLRAMSEGRKRGRPARVWLLSGLIECPRCGLPLYGAIDPRWGPQYKCSSTKGCHSASINMAPADEAVRSKVAEWLDDPAVMEALAGVQRDASFVTEEHERIEAQLTNILRTWAEGRMTDERYEEARDILERRRDALAKPQPQPKGYDLGLLRDAWDRGEVATQKGVIAALVRCPIPLAPGRAENPGDRLTIEPAV